MRYTAYGLNFESELALPELLRAGPGEASAEPDVQIRTGPASRDRIPDAQQLGPFLWVSRDALWLEVPRVATFLVEGGRSIEVAAAPGIDEESVRVFMLGSAFGALLFQRGNLVLHGNAIRVGNQAMVCVGRSGAGKSALAAGFMRRGLEILADDVVAVDGQCRSLPGFPRIKVWRDLADRLGIETAGLVRIRPRIEKFNLPLGDRFGKEPLPIRWIYILQPDKRSEIELEPIVGMQRFNPLRGNTYRMRFLRGMALHPEHLQLCGRLAGRVRLVRVTRPEEGFSLDPLMDRLEADMAENP